MIYFNIIYFPDEADDYQQQIAENHPKKRVSFSEHVQARIYRSNSSILGQKKKNERKARQKATAIASRTRNNSDSQVQNDDEETMMESKHGNDN